MSCPAIPPILASIIARLTAAVPARARSLGEQAREPLHPPVDGDVVNLDTALGE